MEQKKKKKKINTTKTGKMVSFRMSWACVDQLQALADATGQSKSEVLRMGLNALQASQNDQGGQTGAI